MEARQFWKHRPKRRRYFAAQEGGICGHPWLTWGVRESDSEQQQEADFETAPSNRRGEESPDMQAYGRPSPCETRLRDHIKEGGALSITRFEISDLQVGLNPEHRGDLFTCEGDERKLLKDSAEKSKKQRNCERPPYVVDGFVRVDNSASSEHQIGRTDERWSTERRSHVVSFRRQ